MEYVRVTNQVSAGRIAWGVFVGMSAFVIVWGAIAYGFLQMMLHHQ